MNWWDKFNLTMAGATNPERQRKNDYYTRVLRGEEKAVGKTVLMSGADFLTKVYTGDSSHTSDKDIEIFKKMLYFYDDPNYKWNLPYYDINRKKIKGVHRTYACKDRGMMKVPVLLVGDSDKQIDDWLREKDIPVREVTINSGDNNGATNAD